MMIKILYILNIKHRKEAEYIFFVKAHNVFKIDMLHDKTSFEKYEIEIILTFFSSHIDMKTEINYKEKITEHTNGN